MDPVEQVRGVGLEVLGAVESVIRLLGPFRPGHPEWKKIEEQALKSLPEQQAELAEAKSRASDVHREARLQLGVAKHELEQLERGVCSLQSNGLIFRELLRLKHAEVSGDGDISSMKLLCSAEELKAIAKQVVASQRQLVARARDDESQCEQAARPAIKVAEHNLLTQWIATQWAKLDPMVAEYRRLVDKYKLDLAVSVEPVTKTIVGRWAGSSHSAAILEMVAEAAAQLRSPWFSEVLRPVLARVDWRALRHQFENELGAWRRSGADANSQPKTANSTDYVFERIIVEAAGKKLSAAEIFAQAKSNPDTSRQFPMTSINSDHRSRIRSLIGKQTKDGCVIRGDEPRRGKTLMLWSEKAGAQADVDPGEVSS